MAIFKQTRRYRGRTGIQSFVRPEAPNIDAITVTHNGEEIQDGATVHPGDTLRVTITTEPAGETGLYLVGKSPKPDCVLCNFDCATESQHFLEQGFTDGQPSTLDITDQWIEEGPELLIAPSVQFTLAGNTFCLSSFPTFSLTVTAKEDEEEEEEVPPELPGGTIDLPFIGEVSTLIAAGGAITLGLIGLTLLEET